MGPEWTSVMFRIHHGLQRGSAVTLAGALYVHRV